jgi:Family of unknown function (DUF6516)
MNSTLRLTALQELLRTFENVITRYSVLVDNQEPRLSEIKLRFVLSDASILVYSDVFIYHNAKRKYSFQWMNSDNSLRIRWDNAYHHRYISTYPHHKHVDTETNVQESPEMTLEDVFLIITATLQQ